MSKTQVEGRCFFFAGKTEQRGGNHTEFWGIWCTDKEDNCVDVANEIVARKKAELGRDVYLTAFNNIK